VSLTNGQAAYQAAVIRNQAAQVVTEAASLAVNVAPAFKASVATLGVDAQKVVDDATALIAALTAPPPVQPTSVQGFAGKNWTVKV
jgi:hypothetical protein